MTNQELQAWVERVSLADFHLPFRHRATFNARLRITGGRFNLRDENLDFNPSMFATITVAQQLGIIRHELVHYHLYRAHQGYKHRDADFKQLLAAVGGSRYAPSVARRERGMCMSVPNVASSIRGSGGLMCAGLGAAGVAGG